jgi:hypothetical protein
VCALAALVSGEQHPLLTVIAEHSVALLTVVRAMVDDVETTPVPPEPPPDGPPHLARAGINTSRDRRGVTVE